MKAKCKQTILTPMPNGTEKRFEQGVVYDVSDLQKETVARYFEHPVEAPAKKNTRKEKES